MDEDNEDDVICGCHSSNDPLLISVLGIDGVVMEQILRTGIKDNVEDDGNSLVFRFQAETTILEVQAFDTTNVGNRE